MRYCINKIKPGAIIHLGDFYEDGEVLASENPQLPFCQVPGNCDKYRSPIGARETICCRFCNVNMFITHGHNHFVKNGIGALLSDARKYNADIALFGHTHKSYCSCESDGMWVLNPGHCGTWGGSAGVIEVINGKITACYIVQQADLGD